MLTVNIYRTDKNKRKNPWSKKGYKYYRKISLKNEEYVADGRNDIGNVSFDENYPLDLADKKNIVDPVTFSKDYPLDMADKKNIVDPVSFDEDYPLDLADRKNIVDPVVLGENKDEVSKDSEESKENETSNEEVIKAPLMFDLKKDFNPKIKEFVEFNKTYTNKDLTKDLQDTKNKESLERIDKFLDINYPDAFIKFKIDKEKEETNIVAEYNDSYETAEFELEEDVLETLQALTNDGNIERLINLILEDLIENAKTSESKE